KMLKVNGNDLMQNIDIEPGPKLGFILNILLEEVLDDISKNTKEYLLQKAKELNNKDIQELKELSEKARDRYNQILNEEEAEIKRKYYV
ncbi:MAG TPA: hypothetical protein P5241_03235, partial [Candidatus Paceibacterota bacterium]|nr:hypothetical protein [Candidatus Paceibacterota bacterium]